MLRAVVCCIFVAAVVVISLNADTLSYGPYIPHWYNFEKCTGPKRGNISTYSVIFHRENNMYRLEMNLTVLVESKIESVKIMVSQVSGSQKASQWKYKIEQPCKHPVVAVAMRDFADLQKCTVLKGEHRFYLNVTEMTRKFLGTEFFYGDYLFKVLFLAKKGNIVCFTYKLKFEKRI